MAGLEWIKVDVDVGGHPKVEALERAIGPAALGVLLRAWCWTAKYCPDGFVPDDRIDSLEKAVGMRCGPALVAVGLMDRNAEAGGYEIHDWEDLQVAHVEKVEHRRSKNRERQRRFRERNASRNAAGNADVTPQSREEERREEEKQQQRNAEEQHPAAGPVEASTESLAAPPVPPSAPAAPLARREPAAANPVDELPPRRLEVEDAASHHPDPGLSEVELFRARLMERMARTAPLPVGGSGEVLKQIAAALQHLPLAEAVELVATRDRDACRSDSKLTRPKTLSLVAAILADEVSRRAAAPKPKARRVIGGDFSNPPVFAEES